MVKVPINGRDVYIHETIKYNMDSLRERVEKNWDGLMYIGGYEGDGKSTFAGQIAAYLDPTYNLDRCVFTPEQFLHAIENAKPFQAIVYDEAQDAFDSYNSRDPKTKVIKSKLTRIRKKQLFIIIVAPDFWRINKYLFIQRSLCFINVYSKGLERGFFAFYSRSKKHILYIKGKREENIHVIEPDFRGDFGTWFPLDKESYEKKKDDAEATVTIGGDEEKTSKEENRLIKDSMVRMYGFLSRNNWLKKGAGEATASFLGMKYASLRERLQYLTEKGGNPRETEDVGLDQAQEN